MSLTPDHIIFRSEFHPHAPLQVIEFLKNDLKVSRKYVTMLSGEGAEHLGRMWLRHVYLLCLVEPQAAYFSYIKNYLGEQPDLWMANASLQAMPPDADSIDCAVLLGSALQAAIETEDIRAELRRVLRLNSFVLGIEHRLTADKEATFGWAFSHFFKQYAQSAHEYEALPNATQLESLFKDGYEQKAFANQVRLTWDGLQGYYLASKGALSPDDPRYKWALKALRILFDQYQIEGEVMLDYQTELYYGLYNKYVPEISLRKSLFFNLLRPFAFGFYVMVKMNIYFWRSLYSIWKPKQPSAKKK